MSYLTKQKVKFSVYFPHLRHKNHAIDFCNSIIKRVRTRLASLSLILNKEWHSKWTLTLSLCLTNRYDSYQNKTGYFQATHLREILKFSGLHVPSWYLLVIITMIERTSPVTGKSQKAAQYFTNQLETPWNCYNTKHHLHHNLQRRSSLTLLCFYIKLWPLIYWLQKQIIRIIRYTLHNKTEVIEHCHQVWCICWSKPKEDFWVTEAPYFCDTYRLANGAQNSTWVFVCLFV